MRLLLAVTLLVGLAGTTNGQAGDIQQFGPFHLPDDRPHEIIMMGEFRSDTPFHFRRATEARPNASIVTLNSGGGLIYPALTIALEVHDRGMTTYVSEGHVCYSACALVFLAGETRLANGPLGVHQISSPQESNSTTQVTVAEIADALGEFDADPEILSLMLRTPHEGIHVFSDTEIAALQINTVEPAVVANAPFLPTNASTKRTTIDAVVSEPARLSAALITQGLHERTSAAIVKAIDSRTSLADDMMLAAGTMIRLTFGASQSGGTIPYQAQIYWPEIGLIASAIITSTGEYRSNYGF